MNKAIWPLLLLVLGFAAGAAKPPKQSNELVALGKRSYNIWCVACHGETGAGDGSAAQKLDPRPRSFAKEKFKQGSRVDQIFNTIATGLPLLLEACTSTVPSTSTPQTGAATATTRKTPLLPTFKPFTGAKPDSDAVSL